MFNNILLQATIEVGWLSPSTAFNHIFESFQGVARVWLERAAVVVVEADEARGELLLAQALSEIKDTMERAIELSKEILNVS